LEGVGGFGNAALFQSVSNKKIKKQNQEIKIEKK